MVSQPYRVRKKGWVSLSASPLSRQSATTQMCMVPEMSLKSFNISPHVARCPTKRHGKRQVLSRTWSATGEPLLSRRSKMEIPNFHLTALKIAILCAAARRNATVVSITYLRNLSQKLINFDAAIRWNFKAIMRFESAQLLQNVSMNLASIV